MRTKLDIRVQNEGTICLFHPLTQTAKDWMAEHCPDAQYFGNALVVEHRYVDDLVQNAINDGLKIS